MSVSKQQLRREAIDRRDRIDPADQDAAQVIPLFMQALHPDKGQILALYIAKGKEFDSAPLRDALLMQGFICALPVVDPNTRQLQFVAWQLGNPLVPGPFNIQQPQSGRDLDPDIIVMPLLAFDDQGNRLGYGGGYYDATLRALRARKSVQAVGLCYETQRVDHIPAEPHDQKLDYVITPGAALFFKKSDCSLPEQP